jgi:hypothetical protein
VPNPSLTIVNNLEGVDITGNTFVAKQGGAADDFGEGVDVTVTGYKQQPANALATGSARKLFDDDEDAPTDPLYFHLWTAGSWTTEVVWVQIIGVTSNFVIPVYPEVPWVLRGNRILAAANTTALDGSAAPSTEDIDSIVLVNRSGASIDYCLTIVY